MFVASPAIREQGVRRRRRLLTSGLLLALSVFPACSSGAEERTPVIKYDEQGRIKGLFGLRANASADITCKLREYTVDFVNVERGEYLIFQLPSTFRVWVKIEGEMQRILADPHNPQASEFLSTGRKYRMRTYACDGMGHTSYETVSVELLN
jgi:hypothetical protein